MVIVDTPIWINHFRHTSEDLSRMLTEESVLSHPFVIGELACGSFPRRKEVLNFLYDLPRASLIDFDEILGFIEDQHLMSLGLGYIDVHLLGSAKLSQAQLWTDDKALKQAAHKIGIEFKFYGPT